MSPDIDTAVAIAQMHEGHLIATAIRMERCTSSFAHHLGSLYLAADPNNRRILLNAFGHVFLDHRED